MSKDDTLRRVTLENDEGDVYVESTGTYSEIVLKSQKVRVDGDVYCYDGAEGISQRVDGLKTQLDAFNVTELNIKDTELSGRLEALKTIDATLQTKDAELSGRLDALNTTDAELKTRLDALNATDVELRTKDTELSGRIDTLNATDAVLKGVDDGLSSRIDALTNIYVNELNVTDKQLIVTDATLGNLY